MGNRRRRCERVRGREWVVRRDSGRGQDAFGGGQLGLDGRAQVGNGLGCRCLPEGTPYTLWVGAAAGVAHLVVEDAGPGIEAPEAVVGRGVTRAGSTGLGLDIVRQAVEAAGGRIEVGRSALGGARVALVVPLAASRER
jgi:signal transduction histidine kinase